MPDPRRARRPAVLAALLVALGGCDWPVPDPGPVERTGPWPVLVPDAALGLGAAAPAPADPPDLDARRAALAARAAAIRAEPVFDPETADRLDAAGG